MRFPRSAWSVWDSPMLKDAAVMCSFYLGAQYPIVYIYIKFHINLLLMDIPSVSEFTKTWASVCVCVFVCVCLCVCVSLCVCPFRGTAPVGELRTLVSASFFFQVWPNFSPNQGTSAPWAANIRVPVETEEPTPSPQIHPQTRCPLGHSCLLRNKHPLWLVLVLVGAWFPKASFCHPSARMFLEWTPYFCRKKPLVYKGCREACVHAC